MAIVPNQASGASPLDKSFCVPNRSNAGPPATSQYAGEIVYDSTAKTCIVNVGSPSTPYWAPWTYAFGMNKSSG